MTFIGGCGLCTLLSVDRDSLVFPAHIMVTIFELSFGVIPRAVFGEILHCETWRLHLSC